MLDVHTNMNKCVHAYKQGGEGFAPQRWRRRLEVEDALGRMILDTTDFAMMYFLNIIRYVLIYAQKYCVQRCSHLHLSKGCKIDPKIEHEHQPQRTTNN